MDRKEKNMLPRVVDVTAITGQRITGPVTSWQTPDGPFNVEHVAGMSPNGDLLVFYWSPRHDWQVVNVTQITGEKISSPVTARLTPDVTIHDELLTGHDEEGALYVFCFLPHHEGQVVNSAHIIAKCIPIARASGQTD